MKKIVFVSILFLASITSNAQFPSGGGGGGGGRSGGMQMPMGQQQDTPKVVDDTPHGSVKLSGILVDSTDGKPVEYASVALWWKKRVIDGVMADLNGSFALKGLAKGSYKLVVTFVGYQSKSILLNVPNNKGEINLGKILLQTDTKMLKEVVVQGQASLVEDKVDRLVFNAEKDISSAGGTAEDVLKKVPMLAVDLDGNLSIRGSSDIKVLINGKPSSVVAGSIADAIKQIPADMIKSVEVITSPSAKYDSEGSGGIVNIITKKNNLQGITGSVSFGVGTRGSNLNSNLNLKTKKLSIGLSLGGNAGYNIPIDGTTNNKIFLPHSLALANDQTTNGTVNRLFGNGQVTVDYDFDTKNSLTFTSRMNIGDFDTKTNNSTTKNIIDSTSGKVISNLAQYYRSLNQSNHRNSHDFELDYSHKFSRKDEEITFMAQYARQNTPGNYSLNQYSDANFSLPTYKENNTNKAANNETTLQVDYTLPLEKSTLELGGKTIIRSIASSNTLNYDSLSKSQDFVVNPRSSTAYSYNQNVYAAYGTYSLVLPYKWTMKAGMRYEYTTYSGVFNTLVAGSTTPIPADHYGFLAPSFSLSKDLKRNQKIKFNYSKRLKRPSLSDLNPYVNNADPTSISYGNTHLNPEITHQVELGYSKFFKANSLILTLYYRETLHDIAQFNFTNSFNQLVSTRVNNDNKNQGLGTNIFVNLQLTPKMRIGAGGDLTYLMLASPNTVTVRTTSQKDTIVTKSNLSNTGWNMRFNANVQYTIMTGLSAQLFGFYSSPNVQLQGTSGGFYFYNIGLKKDFKNKKGSFGLSFDNPFTPVIVLKTNLQDVTFNNNSTRYLHNQGVRFTFSYNFGKMSFDDNALFKKKKNVNNDDLKSDGGDQSGGQPSGGGRPRQ